jgi:hypothetical protein
MTRRGRLGFGIGDLAFAALLLAIVFLGLPTRWWIVDGCASVTAGLMAIAGVALIADHKHAPRVARWAASVALTLGLTLVTGLAITAAWLWGTYGPVGRGGAAIFGLVTLMAIPYTIVFPAAELLWIGPPAQRRAGPLASLAPPARGAASAGDGGAA